MLMKDKYFADTNIVVYVFDTNESKKAKAIEIIQQQPLISSQVIIESLNVCVKKLKLSKEKSIKNADYLMQYCQYFSIGTSTFIKAFDISKKYGYSHLDSLVIASSIESGCKILYSEDLQHKQIIENKIQIINPFV